MQDNHGQTFLCIPFNGFERLSIRRLVASLIHRDASRGSVDGQG